MLSMLTASIADAHNNISSYEIVLVTSTCTFTILLVLLFSYFCSHYKNKIIDIFTIISVLILIMLMVHMNNIAEHEFNISNDSIHYHRMIHLKHIYPKLPCHEPIVNKHCAKTLTKEEKMLRNHKLHHIMTKQDAGLQYIRDVKKYGKPKNIKLQKPQWWEYL